MRILYDLNESVYKRISELLEKGQYSTVQAFLDISVANQLYLEERGLNEAHVSKKVHSSPSRLQIEKIHDFKEVGRNWRNLSTVEPVPVATLRTQLMPFCNRIFPAKVAARVLCNTLGENQTVDYNVYSDVISQVAVQLGIYLGGLDKKQKRSFRIEALSIGLPAAKRGDKKVAIRRFLEHVVGGRRKLEEHYGMLFTLGLVGMPEKNKLGVTSDGIRFSELENPVLDGAENEFSNLKSCLSKEEAHYYSEIVARRLPEERKTMEILTEIVRSNHTYLQICADYGERLNLGIDNNLKQTVSTELARMRELGIVLTKTEGLKTYYDLAT